MVQLWQTKKRVQARKLSDSHGFLYRGYTRQHSDWEFKRILIRFLFILFTIFQKIDFQTMEIIYLAILLVSAVIAVKASPHEKQFRKELNKMEIGIPAFMLMVQYFAHYSREMGSIQNIAIILVGIAYTLPVFFVLNYIFSTKELTLEEMYDAGMSLSQID